jgi:hypothetical protein
VLLGAFCDFICVLCRRTGNLCIFITYVTRMLAGIFCAASHRCSDASPTNLFTIVTAHLSIMISPTAADAALSCSHSLNLLYTPRVRCLSSVERNSPSGMCGIQAGIPHFGYGVNMFKARSCACTIRLLHYGSPTRLISCLPQLAPSSLGKKTSSVQLRYFADGECEDVGVTSN